MMGYATKNDLLTSLDDAQTHNVEIPRHLFRNSHSYLNRVNLVFSVSTENEIDINNDYFKNVICLIDCEEFIP